jgi:L-fuculose-phosphate aldolase
MRAHLTQQKQQVADFMNRLYERGLTTASGGNISWRISEERMLLTPSATDKGRMTADQIALIGMDGTNYTPALKPSLETSMHLEIYKKHPRIQAIVHAHPPHASTFAVCNRPLDIRLVAESYFVLGWPAIAPYALQGSQTLASHVSNALSDTTHCVIMQNHGVLTVGKTLLQAFDRIEVLENCARINIYAAQLGNVTPLSDAHCAELDEWNRQNG